MKIPGRELGAEWDEWVASRPPAIQELCRRFPPDRLYLLKSSNHRVFLYSYEEGADGTNTLSVIVSGEYNFVSFDRRVFGIKPEDLEECDLPPPGELLGTVLTDSKDIEEHLNELRLEELERLAKL